MRPTSLETYRNIRENGLLSKRKWEVYDIVYKHGPITANEIVRMSKRKYPNGNASSFNARLSELKTMGVAVEVDKTTDKVSGNSCFLWQLTDSLPTKIIPRPSAAKLRAALAMVYNHYDLPSHIKELIKDQLS